MTSSSSLLFKDIEECAPASVHDALCQRVILDHVEDRKLLNSNHLIMLSILLSSLIVEVPALTGNLQMGLCATQSGLTAAVTSLLATAQLTLLSSQGFLSCAIAPWVLDRVPLTVGEKRFQPDIDADIRVRTLRWGMFGRGNSHTDDQGIPMTISSMNKMNRLGSSLDRTMQLDLEEFRLKIR
jgi:hypothetical protein